MNWFHLALDDLFLFLNGLFSVGKDSFSVKSLLLNQELFWVKLGKSHKDVSEVGGLLQYEDYEMLRNKYEKFSEEIPEYKEYVNMFLASGIIKPHKWDELSERIVNAVNRNPLSGAREVFLSFDTVALRRRYYTLISNLLAKTKLPGGAKLKAGFAAPLGVLRELVGLDSKYEKKEISEMCKISGLSEEILDEFFNQLKLSERLQKVGYVEYRKMSKKEYVEELEGEAGDKNIVESLEKFSKRRNLDIMVFSEDSKFIENARAFKLQGIRFESPKDLAKNWKVDWEDVAQLLYTAAVFYGVLEITPETKIYGIWKGKKDDHWNMEQLKIVTQETKLQKFLEENYKILRANKTHQEKAKRPASG
ncbi:MAG: hypothetical protein KIH08_09530 [Candidatus Freyarchaeota archaeon]|nr:hypothetical protein [Candidatus Jordarchaeia archaeon]MBS7268236.1 hypothetical protein [Candidatus Jordarchaeia archaeon]MBS7281389.1 hypothetical protein [Candidatus Jordarchaeia archaeon]